VRIRVDLDLCQGHSVCAGEAPEVFDVVDDKVVVLQDPVDEELREKVKLAIRYCPTRALRLED
jgi:ferredoxin